MAAAEVTVPKPFHFFADNNLRDLVFVSTEPKGGFHVKHPCLSYALRTAIIAAFATTFSACAGPGNPSTAGSQVFVTQPSAAAERLSRPGISSAQAATTHATVRRHTVGLGPVVKSALGGQIFGWDMNENGNDGVLTESENTRRDSALSAVETFDQTTGKITKIVAKQHSVTGNHELVVGGIVANDVGLIDDERDSNHGRNDIFHLMAPVSGGKFTGRWNPPIDHNLLYESIADQQSDPMVAVLVYLNYAGGGPEVLVSDVAQDTFKFTLQFPRDQIFSGLWLIAQDTTTHRAYVPTLTYDGSAKFDVFDLLSGKVSTFKGVNEETGAVLGIAIDSTTDTMCTTSNDNYSVQFYNLKTHKGVSVPLPGAGGQLQDGASVAADPLNHLFLVTQPLSSVSPSGGSTIFVYDENGTLVETINGFEFRT